MYLFIFVVSICNHWRKIRYPLCTKHSIMGKVIYGCQNPNLDPMILRFYNPTYPKRSESFKNLCDCLGSVGSYNFNVFKQS